MQRRLVSLSDDQKSALHLASMVLQFLARRPDAVGRLMTAIGGFIFEEWLESQAQEEKLSYQDMSSLHLPYDFIINGHRVQAKSSGSVSGSVDVRPTRPVVGSTCRRYKQGSFDVLAVHLAAYDEKYFIPVENFKCEEFDGMVKGSFVRERCVQWKDAWHVINGTSGPHVVQKTLF
jgi:hypothetical protein